MKFLLTSLLVNFFFIVLIWRKKSKKNPARKLLFYIKGRFEKRTGKHSAKQKDFKSVSTSLTKCAKCHYTKLLKVK